ncbi:hypothetical protein [Vibrio coralliirubri]|uniref:hypothetical protein n=1 Tax=Vibrio coralliirubri TaxID=1516159 RepID=UPI000AEC3599|nr:hypothetical protein [Vibrio coralliirubri]
MDRYGMRVNEKQKNRLIIVRVCYLVSRLLNLSPLFVSRILLPAPLLLVSKQNSSFPTVRNERDRESLAFIVGVHIEEEIPDISSLDSGMTIQ